MSPGDDFGGASEKTRICPSCRMQISVLAVKCRFCGEEVGKPKEEQRSLSISDLGGETIHHRAPSGSVMDALASFRVEENTEGSPDGATGIEDLGDAPPSVDNIEIDERAFGGTYTKEQGTSRHHAVQHDRRSTFIKIGVGVAVLLIAAISIPSILQGLKEDDADARTPTVENRAPKILSAGGPAIVALEAAVTALGAEKSPENRRILEETVDAVQQEVDALINQRSGWDRSVLTDAVRIAGNAADMHPNETTLNLRQSVMAEEKAYSVMLIGIKDGVAEFTVPGSSQPSMKVKNGETFYPDDRWKDGAEGRFKVINITTKDSLRMKDSLRGNRSLRIETQGMPAKP